MRIEQYLFTCSHCVEQLTEHAPYKQLAEHHDLHAQLNEYQAQLSYFMKTSLHGQSVTPAELLQAQETLQRLHDDVKDDLILAGTHASLAIDKMVSNINTLAEMWQL
ncbi:hypothetical protein [Pseudoalteromonas maricaloris]|uniref:hypothetical protein n=1 Tax=Pseudoalteromonas maricaloris TaxID=184924 RepID=UPI003C23FA09